jgi:hypothetical protein
VEESSVSSSFALATLPLLDGDALAVNVDDSSDAVG